MKKFLLSVITLVYLLMSTGIAMETHYCMGRKAGVEIFATADGKCQKCGMEKHSGCCHDEHRLYKLSTEHKNVAPAASYIPYEPAVSCSYFSYAQFLISAPQSPSYFKSPPGFIRPDICISNGNFRI